MKLSVFLISVLIILCVAGCTGNAIKPYSSDPNKPVQWLTADEIQTIAAYKQMEADLVAKTQRLAEQNNFRKLMLWATLGVLAVSIGFGLWKYGGPLAVLFIIMRSFVTIPESYENIVAYAALGLAAVVAAIAVYQHWGEWFKKDEAFVAVLDGNEKFKDTALKSGLTSAVDIFRKAQNKAQGSTNILQSPITKLVKEARENL